MFVCGDSGLGLSKMLIERAFAMNKIDGKEAVNVVFRIEKSGDKDSCLAVFCERGFGDKPNEATCYAHIGQHSGIVRGYYEETRPAKAHEYASLLAELSRIGYEVTIKKRMVWR